MRDPTAYVNLPPVISPYHPPPNSTTLGRIRRTTSARPSPRRTTVEFHGTLGTIWASLGMTAYYMALTWINILLGLFLSPLFVIPMTWLKDKQGGMR
jgi:hypothetical protein